MLEFKKNVKMNENLKKCTYCKEEYRKEDLDFHIQTKHAEKMVQSLRRYKLGLTGALVGFSIVIGMIWGLLVL